MLSVRYPEITRVRMEETAFSRKPRRNCSCRVPRRRVVGRVGMVLVGMCRDRGFSPDAIQCSDNTDRLFSTRSNDPSGGGKSFLWKTTKEVRLLSSTGQCCGACGDELRVDAQESDFSPSAMQWSDSTDRLFSTRPNDPSGRGVDRGGVTTICTFLRAEPPLGFNEDPASPISGN